jgi:hypothetical protein
MARIVRVSSTIKTLTFLSVAVLADIPVSEWPSWKRLLSAQVPVCAMG